MRPKLKKYMQHSSLMVMLSTDAVTASALLINSVAPSACTLSPILVAHNVFTTVTQARTTQSIFHAIAASPIQIFRDQDHIMDKGGTVVHCLKLVTELSHSCNSVKTMGVRVENSAEVPLDTDVVPLPTGRESIQSQCSFTVHEAISGAALCAQGSSPCTINVNVVDNIASISVFSVPHTGFNVDIQPTVLSFFPALLDKILVFAHLKEYVLSTILVVGKSV